MSNYGLEEPKGSLRSRKTDIQTVVKPPRALKGKSLDLFTTGAIDIPFFALTIALLTIGLIMLFSSSYPYALQKYGDSYYFFKRQMIFAVLGIVVMLITSKLN